MEQYRRKAIFEQLKDYCPFAKKHDFIEVTEWNNGEGFDVNISSKLDKTISITYGEWQLLKKLVKRLYKFVE